MPPFTSPGDASPFPGRSRPPPGKSRMIRGSTGNTFSSEAPPWEGLYLERVASQALVEAQPRVAYATWAARRGCFLQCCWRRPECKLLRPFCDGFVQDSAAHMHYRRYSQGSPSGRWARPAAFEFGMAEEGTAVKRDEGGHAGTPPTLAAWQILGVSPESSQVSDAGLPWS